jgi:hypothetical protein
MSGNGRALMSFYTLHKPSFLVRKLDIFFLRESSKSFTCKGLKYIYFYANSKIVSL